VSDDFYLSNNPARRQALTDKEDKFLYLMMELLYGDDLLLDYKTVNGKQLQGEYLGPPRRFKRIFEANRSHIKTAHCHC
jgi:hypothetical protein